MIHGRVNRTGAEAIRYHKQKQHGIRCRTGKTDQTDHGQENGGDHDLPGAEPPDHPGTRQRGQDGHK